MKLLGVLLLVLLLSDIQLIAQRPVGKPIPKPIANPVAKPVAKTDVPLPEYFGLYLSSGGKLCGLDVDVNPCAATVTTQFGQVVPGNAFGGKIVTSSEIKAVAMNPGSQFVVFSENASTVMNVMKLVPLMFVRNVKVNTGWPNNITRSDVENAWDSNVPLMMGGELGKLNEGTAPVQLLSKPLKDKMMLGVPSRTLAPGLYKLSFGQQVLGNEPRIFFWVGDAKEAERMKCVDAVHQLTGFQISVDYKPCEGQAVVETDTSSAATTEAAPKPLARPAANGISPAVMDKFIALAGRFHQAREAGDKTVLEEILDANFGYYDQRFDKYTNRAKFIEKAKKGDVSSFRCNDYSTAREPAGMPILKGKCEFKSHALLGMVDMSGTFSLTLTYIDQKWLIMTAQYSATPIR